MSAAVSPKVSLVIVSYNCADWLARCLDSLPAALDGLGAEIIMVDNASHDGGADLVSNNYPDIVLIRNETNIGFAAAVNAGAAKANSDWILLLNPDTESRPAALRRLVAFAEENPGHGLYGGRTLRGDGTLEPSSCWALPSLWSTACFALGLSTLAPRNRFLDPESMGKWQRDSVREVGLVTGCLLLVPRPVWRELGGLDERYFVYGEDADFAARARKLGYRPIITPQAEIIHEIGVSSGDSSSKMVLLLAGKVTYFRSHFPGLQARLAVWLLRFGVAWRGFGAQTSGRGKKWQGAWTQRAKWRDGFTARQTSSAGQGGHPQ